MKPRLRTQLGKGPTSSFDCGPRSVQMGIARLRREESGVPSIANIRARMGRVGPQPTNIWNAERAVESYGKGGKPFRYQKIFNIDTLRTVVGNGVGVQICVDYGEWNRRMSQTGSPSFTAGHSMYVFGQKRWNDGTVVWRVYDPLEDGRRNGIKDGRPHGTWRPRWKVIKALEAFYGPGRCYAGAFRGGPNGA